LRGKDSLKDTDKNGRAVIKPILQKRGCEDWTGLNWLKMGAGDVIQLK
jgi:hypothetical protein